MVTGDVERGAAVLQVLRPNGFVLDATELSALPR